MKSLLTSVCSPKCPVSDIIILSMDQAVLSIEAAGGAAQWRDLITSLSPNVTIGICLESQREAGSREC